VAFSREMNVRNINARFLKLLLRNANQYSKTQTKFVERFGTKLFLRRPFK